MLTEEKMLKKLGLLSRGMALGEKEDNHLSKLEGKSKEDMEIEGGGNRQICLTCKKMSRDVLFSKYHKCKKSNIVKYEYKKHGKMVGKK